MLCTTCEAIFRGPFPAMRDYGTIEVQLECLDHHSCPEDLERSALQHCFICDKLWHEYCSFYQAPSLVIDSGGQNQTRVYPASELAQQMFCRYSFGLGGKEREPNMPRPIAIFLQFYIYSNVIYFNLDPSRTTKFLLSSHSLSHRTDSASTMALAMQWFKDCLHRHSKCRLVTTASKSKIAPKRLLQLGQPNPEKVRLWVRNERTQEESHQYLTLSHCWGSERFLTLTTASHRQLTEGIAISQLPQTFQDAIYAAKMFGVEYLWIDSLCILQDSAADWQAEASTMVDIYGGALCNIGATGARGANQGCFYDRDGSALLPHMVTTAWENRTNDEYCIIQRSMWSSQSTPLLGRGWVVQERLMAPRMLHFGERQILWECDEIEACEAFPCGLPQTIVGSSVSRHQTSLLRNFAGRIPSSEETETLQDLWMRIVETYSACDLTLLSDKLIALSGIAMIFQKLTGDSYLAGLWRQDLRRQLLWRIHRSISRPTDYRAPSWSWASVDGGVSFTRHKPSHCFLIEVNDFRIDPLYENPTGPVKGGSIRVVGFLVTLIFDPLVLTELDYFFEHPCQRVENGWYYQYCEPDSPLATHKLHFLPIAAPGIQRTPNFRTCKILIAGLLLEPTGVSKGQFRRCGLICLINDEAIGLPDWKTFNRGNWLEYEAFNGMDKYTITIV